MNDVVIATSTCYPSKDTVRAKLSLRTFKEAKKHGLTVVNSDCNSPASLLEKYRKLGVHLVPLVRPGLGYGKRQAILEALKFSPKAIMLMEPEKVDLVKSIDTLYATLGTAHADIVVPRRSSIASYPTAQRKKEPIGNAFWKKMTGKDLDIYFGPFMFTSQASTYFLEYTGEYGDRWEATVIPVLDALKEGKKVIDVPIDYTHPREMLEEEEGNPEFDRKRDTQLSVISEAITQHKKKFRLTI